MTQVVRNLKKQLPLGYTLREAELRECIAAGMTGEEAISSSIAYSTECYQIIIEEEVVCSWGWFPTSHLSGVCHIWMLTGEAANKHKVFVARESARILNIMLECFPSVLVLVDSRYSLSIKWLRWLGFSVTQMGFQGPTGVIFQYMKIERGE